MPDLIFTIKTPAELDGVQKSIVLMEQARRRALGFGRGVEELDAKLARAKASVAAYNAALAQQPATTSTTTPTGASPQASAEADRYQEKLLAMARAEHDAKVEAYEFEQAQKAAAAGLGESGDATDEASEKTKLFEGHSRELKKTIRELSREFPIAGLALKALASPIAAALTVGIGVFVAIKRHIAEVNAALDQMEASAAGPLSNFAESFRQAQNEAAASTGAFIKKIDDLVTATGKIEAKTNNAVAAIHRLAAAQIELNNAAQGKALAQVNLDEQFGRINPVQAIDRRRQINEFYAAQERQARDKEAAGTLAAEQKRIADLEAARAKTAASAPPGNEVARNARIKELSDQAAAARKLAEELGGEGVDKKDSPIFKASQRADSARDYDSSALGKFGAALGDKSKAQAIAEADAELDALKTRQAQAKKLAEDTEARVAQLKNEQTAAEQARAKIKELTGQIEALKVALDELVKVQAAEKSVRDQKGRLETETKVIEDVGAKQKAEEAEQKRIEAEAKRAEEEKRRLGNEADRAIRHDQTGGPTAAPDIAVSIPGADAVEAAVNLVVAKVEKRFALMAQRIEDAGSRIDDSLNS